MAAPARAGAHVERATRPNSLTIRAEGLLARIGNDAYEAALAALRADTREWWEDRLARSRRMGDLVNIRFLAVHVRFTPESRHIWRQ
jgi:hypothetical protein